jgi:hypothetical protein
MGAARVVLFSKRTFEASTMPKAHALNRKMVALIIQGLGIFD